MWRFNPLTLAPERVTDEDSAAREALTKAPSHFDTTDFSKFLQVGKDKLSLRYTGPGDHDTDVGCIQANHPVPRHKRIFYYEVKIVDAGMKGLISVGFAEKGFNLGKHPGSEPGSYGYCSETGHKMNASSGQQRGTEYGQPYTTGDVVGAGIILDRQEMFFTRNGKSFGKAFNDVLKAPLLPTVGLHSRNEHVEANFAGPFVFDLEDMAWQERQKQAEALESVEISPSLSHEIVQDYLRHEGYADTLHAFTQATGMTQASSSKAERSNSRSQDEWESLGARHTLRSMIISGESHRAQATLRVPESLKTEMSNGAAQAVDLLAIRTSNNARMEFFLTCQAFIELIRAQKVDEAVSMARESLSMMRGAFPSSENFDAMLHDVVALLAYVHPEASPMASLLKLVQREYVADMVNTTLIAAGLEVNQLKEKPLSLLQQLLMQLVATQSELHTANGSLGQKFQLSEHLQYLKVRGKLSALHPQRRPLSDIAFGDAREETTNGVADMEEDSHRY